MIERLMFKLGLDKPNIYDVMNKFIRKNMSKEYIEYLEWNAVSIDSMMIDCKSLQEKGRKSGANSKRRNLVA